MFLLSHGCSPLPLICGSDDDRANLMWKRYLEREDSKIVGMEQDKVMGENSCVGVKTWQEKIKTVEGSGNKMMKMWKS